MKNQIILLLVLSFFYGCYPYQGYYVIDPHNVECKQNNYVGKIVKQDNSTINSNIFQYNDSAISINWLIDNQLNFNLSNKTGNSIKIIWDEAVYIDENGASQKVFHSGVKYNERMETQIPSVIVKGSNISDIIVPVDKVYFQSGSSAGWTTNPLFPYQFAFSKEMEEQALIYKGKTISILLPLQINNVTCEYLFSFKVNDFVVTKK